MQEALALWGHSKKIQSLISRLPAEIQLLSQPILGLNFNFCSLLRGKIDKRPSSKCVWGKDFQAGGVPPPPSFPSRSQSGSNSQVPLPTPTVLDGISHFKSHKAT